MRVVNRKRKLFGVDVSSGKRLVMACFGETATIIVMMMTMMMVVVSGVGVRVTQRALRVFSTPVTV